MSDESDVERRLLAIEAEFAGAVAVATGAESGAVRDRLMERLRDGLAEPPVEAQFSVSQAWTKYLLLALARRYGLEAYRRKGKRATTVLLPLPEGLAADFASQMERMSAVLDEHFHEVAKRIVDRAFDSAPKTGVTLPRWELDE